MTSRLKSIKKKEAAIAFREFWKTVGPYQKKAYSGLFLFLTIAAIAAAIPYLYGRITDLTLGGNIKGAALLLLLWLVLSLVQTILT